MMKVRVAIVVILATLMNVPVSGASPEIGVDLRIPATAVIGEPVPLRIAFTGLNDATYLHFSGADYGPESLVLCAQRRDDRRWYASGVVHFDRDISALRFDFVPLRSDQTFESPVLPINDPDAASLPILRLRDAGSYDVFVVYRSTGSTTAGVLWPVWRGVVASPRRTLTLSAALPNVIKQRGSELESCAADASMCEEGVIGFFQIVRDAAAAKVLARMLSESDVPLPSLVQAVHNQPLALVGPALEEFKRRFPQYKLPGDGDASTVAVCASASLQK